MTAGGNGEGMQTAQGWLNEMSRVFGQNAPDKAEQLKTFLADKAESDRAMATKIARVFSTADGAAVLEWLKSCTTQKATVSWELIQALDPSKVAMIAAYREGENSVVDMIELAIAQAENRRKRKRNVT